MADLFGPGWNPFGTQAQPTQGQSGVMQAMLGRGWPAMGGGTPPASTPMPTPAPTMGQPAHPNLITSILAQLGLGPHGLVQAGNPALGGLETMLGRLTGHPLPPALGAPQPAPQMPTPAMPQPASPMPAPGMPQPSQPSLLGGLHLPNLFSGHT